MEYRIEIPNTSHDYVPTYSIIGKKVLGENGENLGTIKDIFIHPTLLTVTAITLKKMLGEDCIAGYMIESLTSEGALLRVRRLPPSEIIGRPVFDAEGKVVGRVKGVGLADKSNKISSIVVNKGLALPDLIITEDEIKDIGEGVMLKGKVEI